MSFTFTRQPLTHRTPHHLNVLGDFYVEADCCLHCGMPQSIAPELFTSFEEHDGCLVKKQPRSAEELDRMIEVFGAQDLDCIRYRGRDEATIRRIRKVAGDDVIDPYDAAPIEPSRSTEVADARPGAGTKSWWKFW